MADTATKIPFAEAAAPSTPAANKVVVYAKADGLMYSKDDAGVETLMSSGAVSGAVATDVIWDAAGDLAVGTGANTAAKLVKGAAGGVLSMINAAVAWNSGTSFPGSVVTGDRYWRTDLGMEFYWNGTAWVSTQVMTLQPVPKIPGTTTTSVGDHQATITATTSSAFRFLKPSVLGASNIWLVDYKVAFNVSGGTALDGSNKWVATMVGADSTGAGTGTAATVTISSGASSSFREQTTTIGAAVVANTVFYLVTWTKTGTPGTLQTSEQLTYRIIAT